MIIDGLNPITVELLVSAISYGILWGVIFSVFSHIINFWDA